MKYNFLGKDSDLRVSALCLGTMTWGQQNSEKEAHAQLDFAFERGINFIDTAEMYPIPPDKKTYTTTETYIGRWDKLRSRRSDIVVATKVAGPGLDHIRGGSRFTRHHLREAIEGSLKRLKLDYIDLYQLHWPERTTNCFGKLGYRHMEGETFTPFEDILDTLGELRRDGLVRSFGLSNETPWGLSRFLHLCEGSPSRPRMVSMQNPYSLLNRTYEIGLSEMGHRESVGLLAYSPLGFGVLSGKYLGGTRPRGARLTRWPQYTRYTNSLSTKAVERYVALSEQFNVLPAQMALAFVSSRPFVASSIMGATNLEQLEENIASIDMTLSSDMLEAIDAIHRDIPNPAP